MITNLGDGCEICRRPKLAGALCAACAAGSDVPVPNQDRASGDRIVSTETSIQPGDRVRNAHEVEGIVVSVSDSGFVWWWRLGGGMADHTNASDLRLVAKASYTEVVPEPTVTIFGERIGDVVDAIVAEINRRHDRGIRVFKSVER